MMLLWSASAGPPSRWTSVNHLWFTDHFNRSVSPVGMSARSEAPIWLEVPLEQRSTPKWESPQFRLFMRARVGPDTEPHHTQTSSPGNEWEGIDIAIIHIS